MNFLRILTALLFLSLSGHAQENDSLAKSTAKKITGKWMQTQQNKINGEKSPGKDVLTLKNDFNYTWAREGKKKKESGKWKIDNYSKTSNTGKMMELLVLETKASNKKNSIFINQLTDSTLVLRTYDYSKGAPAKDSFIDLHFIRAK